MRVLVIIAGFMHAVLPEAQRQMKINETAQPFPHPLIDTLDLRESRIKAAAAPRPTPIPYSAIYIGGRLFERSVAA